MKKNSFKALFLSLVAAVGMSSCDNGGSSELVDTQILGQCLTCSKDMNTNAQNFNQISFSAQFNYTNNTVDLAVIGIELPQVGSSTGMKFPKMEFKNMPWAYDKNGWKVIEVDSVKPSIVGMNEVPMFKKLNFRLLDVFDGDRFTPGIIYDFLVEFGVEEYLNEVNVVGACLSGKTVSTDPNGTAYCPEEDSTPGVQKPVYWVDFDFENSKADIHMFNAKFLGNMPPLHLVFPDVPFNMSGGIMTFEIAKLTPELGDVPYPRFPISQLKGIIDFKTGMKLSFHCKYSGADYTVVFEGKY